MDRNAVDANKIYEVSMSLPSRGAWIEIEPHRPRSHGYRVAPLAGSVDRNVMVDLRADDGFGRSPRGERG